jgi:hypothetical protein
VELRLSSPAPRSRLRSREERAIGELLTRCDPPRVVFTAWRADARTGEPVGAVSRTVYFVVPESPERTREHVFVYWRLPRRAPRLLLPVFGWFGRLGFRHLRRQDARVVAAAAGVPIDTRGMRLDRFDAALVRSLDLLRRTLPSLSMETRPK